MALLDFFRPQWKHSNPQLRAAAFRALEDDRQEVFLAAALEDPDPGIRVQAARRLNAEAAIREVLSKSQDSGIQDSLGKALTKVVAEKAKSAQPASSAEAKALLAELQKDSKVLEEIARVAKSVLIRREAGASLTHATSFLSVALEEKEPELALAAFAKLSRESHLQSAAKNAECREVRSAAKEKLKALEEAKKPDANAEHRAKLQLLLSVMEKVESGSSAPPAAFAWDTVHEQVEDAEQALGELLDSGLRTEMELLTRFRGQVSAFRTRYGRHKAAAAERAQAEERLIRDREFEEERKQRRELEAIERKKVEAEQKLAEEERRKVEAEIEKSRAEVAERRAAHWQESQPKIQGWMKELAQLAESSELVPAEKRLREIQNRWRSLPFPQGDAEAESVALRWQGAVDGLREVLDWNRWSNLKRKEDICARLEALPAMEDGKALVARFKELIAEWKSIGPVAWDATEALWERYHAICDSLYEKCREYFAELESERESNARAREEICARLEALLAQPDMDWREATETFKEAHSAWKAIGAAPRDKTETLWNRFRTVTQEFYARKDKRAGDNLGQKMELIALAESLSASTDWKATATTIKDAQEKWKSIGPVPRDQTEVMWQKFHGACEAFFQARKAHFEKLDQERPQNLEKKIALCAIAEKLGDLPDDETRYRCILDIQADWKEIGPVPRENEEEVWERFRTPIDAYFQARKGRLEAERGQREENAKVKETLCAEAESLRDAADFKTAIEKIKSLQARWKATGPAPRSLDQELWRRFRSACDGFFDRLKEYGAQRDQEREGNQKKKIDLCFRVEILCGRSTDEEGNRAREEWKAAKSAEGVRVDLSEANPDWRRNTDKVKVWQQEWKAIGPGPREMNEVLWERFRRACDDFFEDRRRALGLPEEDPQHNLESKLALIEEAEQLALDPDPRHEGTLRELHRRWKRIGPVPRAQSEYVWNRFVDASDAAIQKISEDAPAAE